MDTETNTQAGVDAVVQQLETIIAFLQRPVVQQQLLAILLTVLAAYAISTIVTRLIEWAVRHYTERLPEQRRQNIRTRWWPAIEQLFFPGIALMMIPTVADVLSRQNISVGLLLETQLLFWLLLSYELVITVLYAIFSEDKIRPFHYRILLPFFTIIVLQRGLANLIAFDQLGDIVIFNLFDSPILLSPLLGAFIVVYLTFVGGNLLQRVLRSSVLPRFNNDVGVTSAILTITRYVVLFFGALATLGILGIDLAALAFIGAGLSIGLGFGLQQIISNFVSGLLLLFEQSLRPGDIIDVNGELGVVENLSIRSTTIRTLENVDVIIPNETFLTSSVYTYTKSSKVVRGDLTVGVSYASDPTEVRRLLQETVSTHGNVLKNPEPRILFVDFGASSLDFWVQFWVEHPLQRIQVASDLRMMIWKAFEKHGIEIPFPQQDLHLRDGWEKLQPPAAEQLEPDEALRYRTGQQQ
ncbi:MAG: mechanosensitive ion channel domain-containing protein [Chloroflexota bacterium]